MGGMGFCHSLKGCLGGCLILFHVVGLDERG